MQWIRRYFPTGKEPIDNDRLANELRQLAAAHNINDEIVQGRRDWRFSTGAGVLYEYRSAATPIFAPYGKYCVPVDTNNANDFITFTPTENDGTFERITIPDGCQAFTNAVGIAKATVWALTFKFGAQAVGNPRRLRNPEDAGYGTDNGIIFRDDSWGLGNQMDAGDFPFAPFEGATYDVPSYAASPADAVLRSTLEIHNYNTASPFRIQVRVGTNAGGEDGPPSTTRITLRLLGYYV